MVLLGGEHSAVGWGAESLPKLNIVGLEVRFVERGAIHGLTVRQVHGSVVDGCMFHITVFLSFAAWRYYTASIFVHAIGRFVVAGSSCAQLSSR